MEHGQPLRAFAIIGDPIDHSLSPTMHNAAYRHLGMSCTYIAYRVREGELAEGIESLRRAGIEAFNVTMPHKIAVMKFLDHTDENCSIIGATNAIRIEDDGLHGYNADMEGFLKPVIDRRIPIKGARILMAGAGGAARAAVAGFAKGGAAYIRICNRSQDKAADLSKFCKALGTASDWGPLPQSVREGFDIVVNATSMGMGDGRRPTNVEGISPDTVVYDMIYKPVTTPLLKQASDAGAKIIYGWEMLLGQAEIAFEIFTGEKAPAAVMRRSLLGGFG